MKWSRSQPGVSDRNYDNNVHVHVFSACSTYRNYDDNVLCSVYTYVFRQNCEDRAFLYLQSTCTCTCTCMVFHHVHVHVAGCDHLYVLLSTLHIEEALLYVHMYMLFTGPYSCFLIFKYIHVHLHVSE